MDMQRQWQTTQPPPQRPFDYRGPPPQAPAYATSHARMAAGPVPLMQVRTLSLTLPAFFIAWNSIKIIYITKIEYIKGIVWFKPLKKLHVGKLIPINIFLACECVIKACVACILLICKILITNQQYYYLHLNVENF